MKWVFKGENIYETVNNSLEITSARLCYCIWRKTQVKWRLLVKCLDVFLGETEAIVAKWRRQLLVVRQTCASLHHGSHAPVSWCRDTEPRPLPLIYEGLDRANCSIGGEAILRICVDK